MSVLLPAMFINILKGMESFISSLRYKLLSYSF